jgi:D-alanyl-D-alanine carboxypeptidase (penicillin-binding protein 5/6)
MAWNALQIEGLNTYVSTKSYTGKVKKPNGETRDATWENTNQLLGRFGIDGVKTGTTNQAGACLITHPEVAGKRFVFVVLGSTRGEDRFSDTSTLIRWFKGKLATSR